MTHTATACAAGLVVPQIVWRDFQRTAFVGTPADHAVELWLYRQGDGWAVSVNVPGASDEDWRGREWQLDARTATAAKAEAERRFPDLLLELGLCPCGHEWAAHHERWAASGTEWAPGECQVRPCACAAWRGREPEEESR